MENQTGFNLNAAMENWREELAAQSSLAPEARRELETHLCDTVAELQRRGLNDEESFWLARRRVGPPQQLGEEFRKADPARVWRERVLWTAIAFFAINLWGEIASGLWGAFGPANPLLTNRGAPGRALWTVHQLMRQLVVDLPVAWLAISFARGRFGTKSAAWFSLLRSRKRFVLAAVISLLAARAFWSLCSVLEMAKINGIRSNDFSLLDFLSPPTFLWQAMLIAIIAWLLPAEESPTLKRA
jgi:hypothetical protein